MYHLNCVTLAFRCSPSFFRSRTLAVNFISTKHFHTKREAESPKTSRRAVRSRKNDSEYEGDSTVFSYFLKLSSATVVSIV